MQSSHSASFGPSRYRTPRGDFSMRDDATLLTSKCLGKLDLPPFAGKTGDFESRSPGHRALSG
eukprot:11952817-Alexandrium_andersonii.AAC.1